MSEHIKTEPFEHYCILTLSRPEKRNALSRAMREQLITFFQEESEKFQFIILTGIGKAFCAGMDLNENPTPTDVQHFWKVLKSIYKSKSICIAAINGVARGGGVMLINTCDIAISSDKANFGLPEVILKESFEDFDNNSRAELMDRTSSWLGLRGKSIPPQEAKKMGIINKAVPLESLLEEAKLLVNKLDAEALRARKEILNRFPFDNSLRRK